MVQHAPSLHETAEVIVEGQSENQPERAVDHAPVTQLKSQLESLGLLVGTISHSIKGLCTGIDGGIYLMNSGMARGDEARRERGWFMLQRNVNRLRRLVNNTLFYAKEREPHLEKVASADIQKEVTATLSAKAKRLGIALNVSIVDPVGTIEADASAVSAALVNLMENSLDACEADDAKPAHSVTFAVDGDEDAVRFTIEDDGVGMDDEARKKATSLFFSSKGSSGTGLGLYIANKIALAHGGSLNIDSKLKKGTRMTVTLPRRATPQSAETIDDEENRPRRKRVLVIEDEPDVRDYLTCLLEDNDFDAMAAGNGADGLKQIELWQPDLVTLDITMPEKTGIRVYREIKKSQKWRALPVIIVTGITKDFERFISTRRTVPPPEGYVHKPVDEEKLMKMVRQFTESKTE